MPELPEVETIARGLSKRVTGDVIESVWLGQKKEPLKSPADVMAAALEQTRISAVRRMGKHIVFDLDRLESAARMVSSANARRQKPALRKRSRANSASLELQAKHGVVPRTRAQWIVHLGMTGRLQV